MSDLGGSHSWLLDVGGGIARERVADGGRVPVDRPTDDQLVLALGASRVERHQIGDTTEHVRVYFEAGRAVDAVLKVGGFWRSPKERRLYACALDPAVDGSPALVGAGDGWLLIEHLADAHPVGLDDPVGVRAVYRRLAEIHAGHAGRWPSLPSACLHDLRASPLTLLDAGTVATAVEALSDLVERAAHDREIWEIGAAAGAHLAELRAWVTDRGAALAEVGPVTLLHGDYQRGNFLVDPSGARAIDWELAALGPGLIDLYYLQLREPGTGHAPAGPMAERALAWYCERLAELGAPGLSLEAARVHLPDAITWGALAGAGMRLLDYYSQTPRSRTPRGQLPRAAADLLRYAAEHARR